MFCKKRAMIRALSVLAIGSLAGAMLTYAPNTASAADSLSLAKESFFVRGANIQLASGNLRFASVLEKSVAEKTFGADFASIQETGVLVLPTEDVDGAITLETEGVEKTVTKKSDWFLVWDVKGAEGTEFYQFSAMVEDIAKGEELTEYTAVGYITTASGTIYTDAITRSLAQVARGTYEDKNFVYSSTVLPYIPECEVSFVVADGVTMDSISVLYGEEIPDLDVPVREGWEFDGWYLDGEAFSGAGKKVLNHIEVCAGYSKTLETNKTKIDVKYDNVFDLGGITGNVSKVTIGDTVIDASQYSLENGVLTLEKEGLPTLTSGQRYDVQFFVGDYDYYKVSLQASERTLIFNAADFESILESDLSGDYALANDLDFAGMEPTPIGGDNAQFTGTLDGQGYTLKNYMAAADKSVFKGDLELGWRSIIHSIGKGGVVRDLGIEYTNLYWRSLAPFAKNLGLIENVCVKATYTRSDMSTVIKDTKNAGLVCINAGTVRNCVAIVTFSDPKVTLAGAIAFDNYEGATIENCHAVSNVSLNPIHTDKGVAENNAIHESAKVLMETLSDKLEADNGWSKAWKFSNATETGMSVQSLKFGESINCVQIVYLSSGIESKFESVIESDMSAYYVLESDLDFTGVNVAVIGSATNVFTGTIDGQGHSITWTGNTDSNVTAQKPGWLSIIHTIGSGGVIKNLALNYTSGHWTCMSPFGSNSGTIENVFATVNYLRATQTNDNSSSTAGIVATNTTGGVIRNCIVVANFGEGVNIANANSGVVTGRNINSTIENCYGVCNISLNIAKTKEGTSTETNTGVYTSVVALVEAQSAKVTAANGWTTYWTVADGAISFGNNK